MKPIKFEEVNVTYAEDQPEYLPLPVLKTESGELISCWKLTLMERLRLLFSGKLWLTTLTFNLPLQPLLPTIKKPKFIFDKSAQIQDLKRCCGKRPEVTLLGDVKCRKCRNGIVQQWDNGKHKNDALKDWNNPEVERFHFND